MPRRKKPLLVKKKKKSSSKEAAGVFGLWGRKVRLFFSTGEAVNCDSASLNGKTIYATVGPQKFHPHMALEEEEEEPFSDYCEFNEKEK